MPFMKDKLETFYSSCGNAEIHHGVYSHLLMENPNQHVGFMAVKDNHVTELILRFLDNNM